MKAMTGFEKVFLALFLALVVWTVMNYGSHRRVVLAQEPPCVPPYCWVQPPPAPQDGGLNGGVHYHPYGAVVEQGYWQARAAASRAAELASAGFERFKTATWHGRPLEFYSGMATWETATGMYYSANSFAGMAGPPAYVYNCAMDPCCLRPDQCEIVYQ